MSAFFIISFILHSWLHPGVKQVTELLTLFINESRICPNKLYGAVKMKKNIYYFPTVNLKVSTGKNVHAFRADIIQNEKKNMLQHTER